MSKKEALSQCYFYKGESDCPDFLFEAGDRSSAFWFAEELFVQNYGTERESELIENYLDAGLAGLDYDLPLGLLASMFALSCKGADMSIDGCAAFFSENIYPDYIQLTSK